MPLFIHSSTNIYVYLFYNNHIFLLHSNPPNTHRKHTKHRKLLYWCITYFLANLTIVYGVKQDVLPLSSLLGIPSLFGCHLIYSATSQLNNRPISSLPRKYNANAFGSDSNKLAYLYAWQSTNQHHAKIMNFSPGGCPLCIDTGVTSCISNLKTDFIDLTTSSDTVPKRHRKWVTD